MAYLLYAILKINFIEQTIFQTELEKNILEKNICDNVGWREQPIIFPALTGCAEFEIRKKEFKYPFGKPVC